jgi:hypothetical protein
MSQPLPSLLARFRAGLKVLLDKLGGERIKELRGKIAISRIVLDFDEPRVGISADFQIFGNAGEDVLTGWRLAPVA